MSARRAAGLAAALLLALAAPARGDAVEDLLFRARHAQLVAGDLELAIRLYSEVLAEPTLTPPRAAEVHLRLALCFDEIDDLARAAPHVQADLFAAPEVPAEVRRLADDARRRIEARLPKQSPVPPARRGDPAEERRARIDREMRAARAFLDAGDEVRALLHAKAALDLDPDNAAAREIDAELERRLSGVADFIRDPLRFVRKWTETRISQVANEAQAALAQGAAEADSKRFNLAEAAFRQGLKVIDGCEFGADSERLRVLRASIVARWEAAHLAALGRPLDPAQVAPPPRGPTPLGDYLSQLQQLLDLVSTRDREYRLLPVRAAASPSSTTWQQTPEAYGLFRDVPTEWSPAAFARLYLPLRVAPESWSQRGNFLEAAGDILVARHRAEVLDALLGEVTRMEQPAPATLPGRFLLVPVAREALPRLAATFGKFEFSRRGREPVLFRVVPARYGVDYLCSFLREIGAEVRPAHDTFAVELRNGAPQTLFAGMPLSRAAGYGDTRAGAGRFGLLLDVYPLRDRTGRTATGMRLLAQVPAPPLFPEVPRFLTQEAELFVDLPPGATLLVTGLFDPFAATRPAAEEPKELLLLWHNALAGDAEERPTETFSGGAEVSLRTLLLGQRDFPGPQADPVLGFREPEALAVLRDRARFLERLVRDELGVAEVAVDVEEAVMRVPAARREDAAQIVAAMERESAHSYVVEVHTRAVRSAILARWLAREGLELRPLDGAEYALAEEQGAGLLLRNLDPAEPPDIFAPLGEWPKPTALGLQARHLLSARSRTSPVYASEEDLATGDTRTVSEGIRLSVRPYAWRGNTLRVEIDIETCALEEQTEERALAGAIPSHRTRFSGTRVRGTIDLGHPDTPKTALFCRIPHPTESRPDHVVELVVAIRVRRVP